MNALTGLQAIAAHSYVKLDQLMQPKKSST